MLEPGAEAGLSAPVGAMQPVDATGPTSTAGLGAGDDVVGMHAAAQLSISAITAAAGGGTERDEAGLRAAGRLSAAAAAGGIESDEAGLRAAGRLSAAAAAAFDSDAGISAAMLAALRPLSQPVDLRPGPLMRKKGMQLNVRGVQVTFPFLAYRSQLAMMHSVITVAKNRTHALVESPTGTGKSMALLCAALAWQRNETAESEREFIAAIADRNARGIPEPGTASVMATRETLPAVQVPGMAELSVRQMPLEAQVVYSSEAARLAVGAAIAELEVGGALSQHHTKEAGCKVLQAIIDAEGAVPPVAESMMRIRVAQAARGIIPGAAKSEAVVSTAAVAPAGPVKSEAAIASTALSPEGAANVEDAVVDARTAVKAEAVPAAAAVAPSGAVTPIGVVSPAGAMMDVGAGEQEFITAIANRDAREIPEPGTASVMATRQAPPVGQVPGLTELSVRQMPLEARVVYSSEAGRLAVGAVIAELEVYGALSQHQMNDVGCKVLQEIVDAKCATPVVEESMMRIRRAQAAQGMVVGAASRSGPAGSVPVLSDSARVNLGVGDASSREQLTGKRAARAVAGNGDDDDFVEAKKIRDTSWQNSTRTASGRVRAASNRGEEVPENAHLSTQMQLDALDSFRLGGADAIDGGEGATVNPEGKIFRRKSGRIFYSSRTHAQLKQVTNELKFSGYKPRMTILASRNEYCLNPIARRSDNTKDSCDKLVGDGACRQHKLRDDVTSKMRARVEPFDIEEMNDVGRDVGGCTYFAAVDMMDDAELILCPYSYLLDANIRRSREISVKGDIVIFDEAHNIEDHAREAASFTQDQSNFRSAVNEIQELTTMGRISQPGSDLAQAYLSVQELMAAGDKLCALMISGGRLRQESNSEVATYDRDDLVDCLAEVNLTHNSVHRYDRAVSMVLSSRDEDYQFQAVASRGGEDMDAGSSISYMASGKGTQGRNIRNGGDGARSRRASKGLKPGCKCMHLAQTLCTPLLYALDNPESYVLALKRVANQWEHKTELNLWCLNAAVPFKELSDSARSIIVTSGTLTPLESFAGELNINFSIAKSLPHVVNVQEQVYTSVVANGPGLVRMDTTYRNTSNFKFQDSLGAAIVEYCKIIPGGVLIFFPSYRLLNLLVQRWKSSGCWEQIELTKGLIVCESSKRGREFKDDMKAYNYAAHTPDGAVMLGVCRGKISEGLDFKDDAARGVLIIGIPYPSFMCPQLKRKREWNDHERKENEREELLSGSAWYDMQAFRALNQAVGRCVRHRKDYGAIVLIDQRFRSTTVAKQLPGWVRGAMRPNEPATHEATVQGLTAFFAKPRSLPNHDGEGKAS